MVDTSFLHSLNKAPRVNVIVGSIGASLCLAAVFHGFMLSQGEKVHTMSDSWRAANRDYMKFQKMNPIFGISSKD